MVSSFNRVKKWVGATLAALMIVGSTSPAASPAHAAADNSNVVISQVYGGGGNSGATYKNDFVELYNPTDSTISLANWSVQYGSATSTTNWSGKVLLTGSMGPKSYYLIKMAGGTTGAELPTAEVTNTSVNMSGSNGKVALVNNTATLSGAVPTGVVDFVGYGSANGFEGAAAAPVITNGTAALRKEMTASDINNGKDTDENGDDFKVVTPMPRNGSVPFPSPMPGVVMNGTQVALHKTSVSASVYYSVYAQDSSVLIPAQLYTGPITINQNSTIKTRTVNNNVYSDEVSYSYILPELMNIGVARTKANDTYAMIEGIVTYIDGLNFYVQDSTGGIVVRGAGITANVGDKIKAAGKLIEFRSLKELEVSPVDVTVTEVDAGIPDPMLISEAGFTEANEGRLVKIEDITFDGASSGDYTVSGTAYMARSTSWLETGKHYDAIVGVLYSFDGQLKVLPRSAADVIENSLIVLSNKTEGVYPAGMKVRFSTPKSGAQVYLTVDGSEPTADLANLYTAPIVITSDEITVKAIAVNGSETSEVHTFKYMTQKTYSDKKIHDIQGAGHVSPIKEHKVTGVQGVVTHTETIDGTMRFYIQELTANYDSDINTSEAILVISSTSVAKGDYVTVDGTVSEIKEDGYSDAKDLTTTALTSTTVSKTGTQATPAPVIIGVDRIQPKSVIDNDGMATFDPVEDSLDFYESLESMRVQLDNPKVVGPFDFEIPVVVGGQTGEVLTPNGGLMLTAQDLNPQRILIKKESVVKTGDQYNGSVIGVLGYDFSNFKVLPTEDMPAITSGNMTQEVTSIVYGEDKLTIAGFNIENFWNNPSSAGVAKKNKIAQAIVESTY
ncbi:MAG: hypothetical protein K0S39_3867 [Paenibacillus sp.]|nr:hypothetical protein [Paenibacillus sp.]